MPRCVNKIVVFLLLSISCCFCVFTCKAKEPEIKKIGNIDKPLNLSLLFISGSGGILVSYDTIDGNVIETLLYPSSINITNDSIILLARLNKHANKGTHMNKEYRDKLTDAQHLEIKKMISALNQEYKPSWEGPLGDKRACILEIDNQVHYKYIPCSDPPKFSHPSFSPMPKEIIQLFQYIVDLSPINNAVKENETVVPRGALPILLDNRDGKKYKAVKIGSQIWMAENLNYNAEGSVCYENKPENCEKYGRLYNWEIAKRVCPEGWHLPSYGEWDILMKVVGGAETAGKKLKTKSGWNDTYDGYSGNGVDEYGFSALPSGIVYPKSKFYGVGYLGFWWSTGENNMGLAYHWGMNYDYEEAYWVDTSKSGLFSVRCLKNHE